MSELNFYKNGRARQFIYVVAASLSSFTTSASYVWLTPLLYYFKQPGSSIYLTSLETTCLTIMVDLSSAVFSVPMCYLADTLGRKTVLCCMGPIYTGSWLLVALIPNKGLLFAMRAIQGVAVAIGNAVLPIYLSEVATEDVRGGAVSFMCTLWQLGMVYVYFVALFCGFQGITWFTLAPNIITTILFFWCPESPYWCLLKNKKEDAVNALLQMRGGCSTDSRITEELATIEDSVLKDKENNKGLLRNIIQSRKDRKSFLIVEGITVICMFVGVNTIPINASDTIAILSGNSTFANYTTLTMGVVSMLMTIPSIILSDRWGRRPILLLSSAVSFIVFLLAAVTLYCVQNEGIKSTAVVTLSYLCIIVGASFNAFGVSTLQSILVGEMFSTNARSVTSGITYTVLTVSSTVSLALYSYLEDTAGIYANFIVFSVVSFVGLLIYWLVLPETKGKTLGEIQDAL